jgi:hypothetical protein
LGKFRDCYRPSASTKEECACWVEAEAAGRFVVGSPREQGVIALGVTVLVHPAHVTATQHAPLITAALEHTDAHHCIALGRGEMHRLCASSPRLITTKKATADDMRAVQLVSHRQHPAAETKIAKYVPLFISGLCRKTRASMNEFTQGDVFSGFSYCKHILKIIVFQMILGCLKNGVDFQTVFFVYCNYLLILCKRK